MKKVENVSIGGYAFCMDAAAAQSAKDYLDELAVHYAGESEEVLEGIEERMAELLGERACGNAGVISCADVEAVIAVLGRPESIDNDSPEPPPAAAAAQQKKKRLYRDLENRKILGVCSGIARYLDIQIPFVRLFFLLLFVPFYIIGAGSHHDALGMPTILTVPALYLILALCTPAARTVRQKWESKGEDGSLEGIRRSVSQAADGLGKRAGRIARSESWNGVTRVLQVVVGIILFTIGFAGLFAGGLFVFGHQIFGYDSIFSLIVEQICAQPRFAVIVEYTWIKILATAVYSLPFIGMLYAGIMLTFDLKSPKWHPGLIIFVLWLLCVTAFVILLAVAGASWYQMPIGL